MKIFLGFTNIASQIDDFRKGFDEIGISTLSAVDEDYTQIIKSKTDYNISEIVDYKFPRSKNVLNKIKRRYYRGYIKNIIWKKAIEECDVFLFIWNSFKHYNADYKYLKKLNKKIITFICGDEIRWKASYEQDYQNYKLPLIEFGTKEDWSIQTLNKKLAYLRTAEKYSDIILSLPDPSQLALRPYHHNYVPIDLNKFKNNTCQRNTEPIVGHGASRKDGGKGTKYVVEVISKLKNEGIKFKYREINNVPYDLVNKEYEDVDIWIGQLLSPGAGKQDREVLACGKVLLTSMAYKYSINIPAGCPAIDVNPANLYNELKSILLDHPKRIRLARMGRPYIEKYYGMNEICHKIINLIKEPQNKFDYYPNFFRDKFIPESADTLKIYNKWTYFIKDCEWYKEYVKPGERAGLKFL